MKNRNITLLTAFAAAVALAPTAQASITATGNFDLIRTQPWATFDDPNPGDWKLTYFDGSLGAGTLNVAGGSLFDANGTPVSVGWGAGTSTITVTGPGSEILASNGFVVGNNTSAGALIVEDGGSVDVQGQLMIGKTGPATGLVTGVNSKLTTDTLLLFGQQTTGVGGILTVEDSGLVQTPAIQFGFDPSGGYLHMGVGGVLAVQGDKTGGTPFAAGGLFTIQGAGSFGEIQYNPSGDGTTWVNMTGAPASAYTLTYSASGPTINGQDLSGYTVLTMLGGTTPAADPEINSITVAGGIATIIMKGTDGTNYSCKSSTTLDDGFPTTKTTTPASPITTTGGTATFTVDASEAKKFYVVEE